MGPIPNDARQALQPGGHPGQGSRVRGASIGAVLGDLDHVGVAELARVRHLESVSSIHERVADRGAHVVLDADFTAVAGTPCFEPATIVIGRDLPPPLPERPPRIGAVKKRGGQELKEILGLRIAPHRAEHGAEPTVGVGDERRRERVLQYSKR